jgi:hypothetical protein
MPDARPKSLNVSQGVRQFRPNRGGYEFPEASAHLLPIGRLASTY